MLPPRARSSPLFRAAERPLFPWCTTLTLSSEVAQRSSMVPVESVDPSSTAMTSILLDVICPLTDPMHSARYLSTL